jgi:hypothetical protein
MRRKILAALIMALFASFVMSTGALAHTPMCYCYLNGDGTITCEGRRVFRWFVCNRSKNDGPG